MKLPLRTIIVFVLLSPAVALARGGAQDTVPPISLDQVLSHASEYVIAYEAQLETIIGEEEYLQQAEWRTQRSIGLGTTWKVDKERRLLSSDFLLMPIEGRWYGVRNVRQVDGLPVESGDDFASDLPLTPSEMLATWPDNVRYNIGSFERTFNIPTFALTVLRRINQRRFTFEKREERLIDGMTAWEVRFSEVDSPTLVQGLEGENRFATGTFWIQPETGEVLETELAFEMTKGDAHYTATVFVFFLAHPELGILVPRRMDEHYEGAFQSVHTRADYRNFKRFQTEVKLDLSPVPE